MKLRFVPVQHNIRPRASSTGSGSVIARRGTRLGRPVHLAPCFVSRLVDCFGAKAPRNDGTVQPRLGIFKPALALLYVLATILTAHLSVAEAAAPGLQSFANHAPQHPLLRRTGGGCGWDYPCPPDPEFARPANRPGQVTIHNNYGPVNIYSGGSRHPERPVSVDPGFCREDPCRYGCGGYPCTEKCGPLCWMRRFSQGYCGHGCRSYLDQARGEAEERAAWKEEEAWQQHKREWMYEKRTECAPPNCAPDYDPPAPPPPPPPYYYDRPPEREYLPPPPRREPARPDLTPREHFEGPQYPPR